MSKQVFFDSASAWLYLVFRRGWGCDELALLRNKTHACRFLQVLCHAIVNLLPGGESSQVQEQHQVRIYTMIKQYPLHRIYVTSFAPPPPPPSTPLLCGTAVLLPLVTLSGFGCTRDLVDVASNYAIGPVLGNLAKFQNMHLELTKYCWAFTPRYSNHNTKCSSR